MPSEPAESQLQEQGARARLPDARAQRRRSGPTWARARRRRRCPTSRPTCSTTGQHAIYDAATATCNWMQGLGGRDRHGPRGLPARRRRPGRGRYEPGTLRLLPRPRPRDAQVRRHETPSSARPTAPTARPRTTATTGASPSILFPFYTMIPTGALGAGRPHPRLRADGRRPHDAVGDRRLQAQRRAGAAAPASAVAPGRRAAGSHRDAQRHRLATTASRLDQNLANDYLIDREAQAQLEELHRHPRHPPAGHGRDREHGPDLRPHPRAPRHHGRADHPHAPPLHRRGEGAARARRRRRPASTTRRSTASAPAR